MNTTSVFVPGLGHEVKFTDRLPMKFGHPIKRFTLHPKLLAAAALPIDWTKNNTLSFPLDGNDKYGDCLYAAACHGDNTFTGNVGTESVFDLQTIINDYLALSGGDNGLEEAQITGEWKKGLAGTPAANIIDVLDIDPTNAAMVQTAIQLFGGIIFMFAVPNAWINEFTTGVVWTSGPGITANPQNGHGVWWNGCDTNGNYKLQTWGTYAWITPAGVTVCDPSAFVVFSLRWFNSAGIAPNGMTYDQLAALWVQSGGSALPPSPFTPPPSQAPTITSQPTSQTVAVGQTATFSASANGTPTPAAQWQVSIDSGNTFNAISGATNNTLSVPSVTTAMNGYEYETVFTNSAGSATTNPAILAVSATPPPSQAPTITSQPTSQTVTAGQTVTFSAAASGTPTPTTQWQVSTNNGSTFSAISGATNNTLTVPSVTAAMSGYQYEAIFTNSAGSVTTNPAILAVNTVPIPPIPTVLFRFQVMQRMAAGQRFILRTPVAMPAGVYAVSSASAALETETEIAEKYAEII